MGLNVQMQAVARKNSETQQGMGGYGGTTSPEMEKLYRILSKVAA